MVYIVSPGVITSLGCYIDAGLELRGQSRLSTKIFCNCAELPGRGMMHAHRKWLKVYERQACASTYLLYVLYLL